MTGARRRVVVRDGGRTETVPECALRARVRRADRHDRTLARAPPIGCSSARPCWSRLHRRRLRVLLSTGSWDDRRSPCTADDGAWVRPPPREDGVPWPDRCRVECRHGRHRGHHGSAAARPAPRDPLAGAALVTTSGGNLLFGAVGLLLSVPLLRRLYRRFGTWKAPAIGVALFTVMFSLSAFVIGPAISGNSPTETPEPASPTTPTEHTTHHPG